MICIKEDYDLNINSGDGGGGQRRFEKNCRIHIKLSRQTDDLILPSRASHQPGENIL